MVDFQNADLRTLAIIEANFSSSGFDRPTEYLIPLIGAVISEFDGEPLDIEKINDQISLRFLIDLPVYLTQSLTGALVEKGYLRKDSVIQQMVCKSRAPAEIGELSLKVQHVAALEEKLNEFASKLDVSIPLASENWQQALMRFFASDESPVHRNKLNSVFISNPQNQDNWLIATFIKYIEKASPSVFQSLKKVYAAYSIADTISKIAFVRHDVDWKDLKVIYDSTVLMRLLGSSGALLQKATKQTHELLQDMGCQTYYFHDNYEELINNLDSSVYQIENGRNTHKETVAAISNQEVTVTRLRMMSATADKMLAEMNITQFDLPRRLANVNGQINPEDLEKYLENRITYKSSNEAVRIDADAIEKILFLRKGVLPKGLADCGFIFVTHNHKFTKYATYYCRENIGYRETTTPPIITINTLTRLAWLANGKTEKLADVSTELALNCYQASVLDEKWYEKFYEMVESHNPELIGTSNPQEALYLMDLKRITEDATLGCAAVLEKVNWATVLEKANKVAQEREHAHRTDLDDLHSRLKAVELDTNARVDSIERQLREEAEREKQAALSEAKFKHEEGLKTSREEVRTNVIEKLERKAEKIAKRQERVISLAIAIIFMAIFLISMFEDKLGLVMPSTLSNTLFMISGILGAIQVVGLFIPKVSLLFFGPWIKDYLYRRKLGEYVEALSE